MHWQSQFFGFAICVLLFRCVLSEQQSYELIIEKINFDMVPGQTTGDGSNLFLMGRNRVINGTLEIFEDMDEGHYTISIALYSDPNGNGEFRPLPYSVPKTNPCAALREYGSYLQPSLQPGVNTNFPSNGDVCPIPKGVYYFNDVEVKADNFPSQAPRGFLKAIMSIFKDDEYVGEMEILCRVEDKSMSSTSF